MKNLVQPLVQRWREESSDMLLMPPVLRRPFRLWMTGSIAVVMAAMTPLRSASETDRNQAMRLLRHSPYDVGETLQRLELAARAHGLSVLARVPGTSPVLVLAASMGGTLVVMHDADSRPAMPLGLMVSAASDGGADVRVAEAERSDWSELPPSVVADLRALPDVVDSAFA